MPKENLSQRVLLEVLTKEIEVLKKSTETVKRSVPAVEEYLKEIEKTKIKIDVSAVEDLLKGKTVIPQWFAVATITISLLAVLGFGLAFYFKSEADNWENSNRTWYDRAIELGWTEAEN